MCTSQTDSMLSGIVGISVLRKHSSEFCPSFPIHYPLIYLSLSSRPGIVDLPSEGGVVNTDAITLPEIFHDFETAVADLGSVDSLR